MEALRQAEAVAFLRALREVGDLRLERLGAHAFVLRFEAETSLEALKDNLFCDNEEVPLEELFEKYGADLFRLLQQEAG